MNINRINTVLLVAIGIINGYVIVTPFLPNLLYALNAPDKTTVTRLERVVASQPSPTPQSTPKHNKLIIPSLGLDEPIHTGRHASVLNQGLWLRPQGSTPDQASNTVIAGHRFTYTEPRGVLYHLDKIRIGDTIGVLWQGTMYRYKVQHVKVVAATDTSVEAPTSTSRLTLYTCTPLWLPKDRLVVIADQEAL